MDRLSPEKRSWLMSKVRSKDTTAEMVVRSALHAMGYRYRVNYAQLPGKPDLAFTRRRKVIFVNGCFWHGHTGCRHGKLPKSKIQFWAEKISKNRKRDANNIAALAELGWKVLVIWQCELKEFEKVLEKIHDFLES